MHTCVCVYKILNENRCYSNNGMDVFIHYVHKKCRQSYKNVIVEISMCSRETVILPAFWYHHGPLRADLRAILDFLLRTLFSDLSVEAQPNFLALSRIMIGVLAVMVPFCV